jgi:UDP-N-acetyl-D-galactosamine dehydrogenase
MIPKRVCVVGLGYVGFPLAIHLAHHFKVTGFDVDEKKIEGFRRGINTYGDITDEEFKEVFGNMEFTSDENEIKKCDFIIIAVPTPTTKDKRPDLSYLESASRIVGRNLRKGATVVYESTTYPGCTEEFCLPILEKESGMRLGEFHLGYSPERINPGDSKHTIEKITKIISGDSKETVNTMKEVYGKITNVYVAPSIRVAEAAKVIENVQRDINIALFNELAVLFDKMGIDSKSVFDAAATKWNFIRFNPGLVGGHCIPVDPYYLAQKSMELGYIPELILAGRRINENVSGFIATKIVKLLIERDLSIKDAKVIIFGATYKENVPDLRESKVEDLIDELMDFGIKNITIFEPMIERDEIFGITNTKQPSGKYDVIVYAVNHDVFSKYDVKQYLKEKGIVIDTKRVLAKEDFANSGFVYWGL